MKAISLWQPWASAIPAGVKTIETRSWATTYRGPLAIHASKRWTKNERLHFEKYVTPMSAAMRAFQKYGEEIRGAVIQSNGGGLPLGCIVATCELYDCISTNEDPATALSGHKLAKNEADWGNFSINRYAWLLRDIKPIQPVPFVGKQGFFDWTP